MNSVCVENGYFIREDSVHRISKVRAMTFQEGLKHKNGVNLRFDAITTCSKQCLNGQESYIRALRVGTWLRN